MTAERRNAWVARGILAAVPTLLFADLLLGLRVLYVRDVAQYHYPLRSILRRIVSGGEFPYWNAWLAGGQPLAANPAHQLFYPLTWLNFLPSLTAGFHLHVLAHVYIAAFGMYALLRSMNVARAAAVVCALSFGIGGLVTSMLNLFPFLFSTAWLPWICLYARRVLRGGTRRDFALAALFLALQLLVAEPTTAIQTGVLLGLYAIFHGAGTHARKLGLVAALVAVATLIAAIQILPMLDHFGDSVRSRGIPFETVSFWSVPPVRLAEFVNPQLLGDPDPNGLDEYWGAGVYERARRPFYFSIYSGLLIVAGVVAGLVLRTPGVVLFRVLAVLSLVAALGSHTPLLGILYRLGIANAVRYPEKFLLLGIFASIVFAARPLDALFRGDPATRRIALRTTGAIAAIATAIALLGFTPLYESLFRRMWLVPDGFDVRAMLPHSQATWGVTAARAAALALLLLAATRLRRPLWLALVGAFLVADLGSLVPRIAPRATPDYYDPPAAIRQLPRDRDGFRLYHLGNELKGPVADDYYRPRPGIEWTLRNAITPLTPATYGVRLGLGDDYDLTWLLPTQDLADALADVRQLAPQRAIEAGINMANIRYVAVFRDARQAFTEARSEPRDIQPVQVIDAGPHPRYYFARELVTVRGRRDFAERLARGNHGPATAFIAEPSFVPAPAIVHGVRETTQSARIDVEARGPAFLVMSVTPHKYWRITVDGQETQAIVTNAGFQGVAVPAGRHVVEMRYHNPLVAAGAALSVTTLLALFLFARKIG